ncbi:MAG: carbamoyltransferase N-terminal domain-containing protein, partial [Patescibacteria group bacterium]
AEERFTRIKHDNAFPVREIQWCLLWAGLSSKDIDMVVFYEKPIIKFDRLMRQHIVGFPRTRKMFIDTIGSWFDSRLEMKKVLKKEIGYVGEVSYVRHHEAHMASSYFLSPFSDAVLLSLDCVGEWATTMTGVAKGKTMTLEKEVRFPHSLGLLYSTITSFLGFSVNESEYKVMGLAAFGDPKVFRDQFRTLVQTNDDGSFALNMKYFDFIAGERMYTQEMPELFGVAPRSANDRMKAVYENIAAGLQERLEEIVISLLRKLYVQYKIPRLCLSGGVALNSVLNGKITKNTPFTDVFIPPDPGDGGASLGAALFYWNCLQKKKSEIVFSPYLCPSFPDEQIEEAIKQSGLSFTRLSREALLDSVSTALKEKKVVGWFQGRMEWGPRALGNRSILASPLDGNMKELINKKVKHREPFRPFAPVVRIEDVNKYFVAPKKRSRPEEWMLEVYPFTEEGKKSAPATVHVDGTGRLQTVRREGNPLYYDLITSFGEKTGIPILLNTSFNVAGEPIVCTPKDALSCFLGTDIDMLVIGSFLVRKNGINKPINK